MGNFGALMYGDDYKQKMESFDSERKEIEKKYEIEYNYFTLLKNTDGTILLSFDINVEIPSEMQKEINELFSSVFAMKNR